MNNFVFTTDLDRGAYDRLCEAVAAQIGNGMTAAQVKANYKIMPSELNMCKLLVPGTTNYNLSPRKGVDPVIPTAVLLDQQDFFFLTAIGIRISRVAYASGVYSNWGNFPNFTFPDSVYFSGNGTTALRESDALLTLVNGTLDVRANNDTLIDPMKALAFMYEGERASSASPANNPQFGGNNEMQGFRRLTPQFLLDGSQDNSFNLVLAPGTTLNIDGNTSTGTTDSGTRNYVSIVAQGFKIKAAGSQAGLQNCKV